MTRRSNPIWLFDNDAKIRNYCLTQAFLIKKLQVTTRFLCLEFMIISVLLCDLDHGSYKIGSDKISAAYD